MQLLLRRCEEQPGGLVSELLAELHRGPQRLARLLGGEPLRCELLLSEKAFPEVWLVFTANGHVVTATHQSRLGSEYRPHVLLRGSSADVLRAVLGVTPLERAVYSGVLLPFVPIPRIKRVLDHVAGVLVELVEETNGAKPGAAPRPCSSFGTE